MDHLRRITRASGIAIAVLGCGGREVLLDESGQAGAAETSGAAGAPGRGASGGSSADGGASGVSGSMGGSSKQCLTGDVLDPREVYLVGRLEAMGGPEALVHWGCPNSAVIGFDSYFERATIRPSDGRLIYTITFDPFVRSFTCDTCPYTSRAQPYATDPTANDAVVNSDCPNDSSKEFMISPDGSLLVHCRSIGEWHDMSGAPVFFDGEDILLDFGYDGWALTKTRVLNLATGESHAISGLPRNALISARRAAPAAKFLVQLEFIGGANSELWEVDSTGTATQVGEYSPFPIGYMVVTGIAMDSQGDLFEIASESSSSTGVIIRRTVGAPTSEIVYTEATNPLVKVFMSRLVTGP